MDLRMKNAGQLNANVNVEVFSKSMGDHDPSNEYGKHDLPLKSIQKYKVQGGNC